MKNMPTVPTWTYQSRLITDISDMPKGTYGFVYLVVHRPTGIHYIGKKVLFFQRNKKLGKKALQALKEERAKNGIRGRVPLKQKVVTESDWKDYFGSHKAILELAEDNEGRNWEKRILEYAPNKKLLTYYEAKYLFERGVLETPNAHFVNDNILGKFYTRDFK